VRSRSRSRYHGGIYGKCLVTQLTRRVLCSVYTREDYDSMFFTRSHIRTLFTGLEIPRYGHRRKVMRHCVNCSFFFLVRDYTSLCTSPACTMTTKKTMRKKDAKSCFDMPAMFLFFSISEKTKSPFVKTPKKIINLVHCERTSCLTASAKWRRSRELLQQATWPLIIVPFFSHSHKTI
jgi:hypothetical protein